MIDPVKTLLEEHRKRVSAALVDADAKIASVGAQVSMLLAQQSILIADRSKLAIEMNDVTKAIGAISGEITALPAIGLGSSARSVLYHRTKEAAASPYSKLTIKQLVLKALEDNFPEGANANDLLLHFKEAYGRSDITRTSLSPQLSRLKGEDFKIQLVGRKWVLLPPVEPEMQFSKGDTKEPPEGGS